MTLRLTLAALIAVGLLAYIDISSRWVEAIDGDTLRIGWTSYRIEGLASPERHQPGGPQATAALAEIIAYGVSCEPTGAVSWDREVAVCTTSAGDVAALMIMGGWGRDCARYSGGRYAALETNRELPLPDYCEP